ncbi:DUF418 domain-containing protein [Fibrisoma montanum]|uniref:DUF418 domain-containing protein n=1 Tax=Fibrisoma montanum TaxID=2305895 RepID=A0A418LXW6_9BACT|nr:DUF418 domain-containing protein [Fibrisoma montanum]RIV18114.1 DUF418 domain-containing protein [Fibrisoma montanum]
METINPSFTTDEAPDQSAIRPVLRTERIKTIDVIRGFALLGILLMNIPYFGLPFTHSTTLLNLPADHIDYQTNAVVSTVFEGTMRALFSMLFGASALLFLAKPDAPDRPYSVADYYYRRTLWLVVFGLFNAFILLWPGDILYTYGLCGLLLFPFRKMKPTRLLLIAGLCIVILLGKGLMKGLETKQNRQGYLTALQLEKQKRKLTSEQTKAKEAWLGLEKRVKPDPKKDAEIIKNMRGNYAAVFTFLMPLNVKFESIKFYHDFVWDALAMIFIGMALFKLGFFSNKLSARLYLITLVAGYGIGLTLGWLAFQGQVAFVKNPGQVIDSNAFPVQALYQIRRAATALGHASLLLLLFRSNVVPWLMQALANVGQMAFSNYLMQSMICTLIFYGYGLGYYGRLAFHELYYVVAGIWLFQIIFSAVWLRSFRMGPLEWVWRSLTYWKRQPMQREFIHEQSVVGAPAA